MLAEKFKNHHIILASQSPRRRELLAGLNVTFTTTPLHVEEDYAARLQGKDITEYLCRKKAKAYPNLQAQDILITSDTIVWKDDRALEKPKDRAEAKQMLFNLRNSTHTVITSVGIFSPTKERVFSDTTRVTFGDLTQEEIAYYVEHYNPLDKAGAYGVQDWIGFIGVEKIEGSFYTVMGLPVYLLYQELKKF